LDLKIECGNEIVLPLKSTSKEFVKWKVSVKLHQCLKDSLQFLRFFSNPYAWVALGTAVGLLGGYYLITKTKFGSTEAWSAGGGFNFFGLFGDCNCPVHGATKNAKEVIRNMALPPSPPMLPPITRGGDGNC